MIVPGKRTMHTLNCYLTTVDGEVAIVGGTPGGDFQPQCGIQILTQLIDGGIKAQDAVESPRWYSFPGTDPATINRPGELRVEMGMPEDTIRDLTRMGHNVVQSPLGSTNGVVQLIIRDQAAAASSPAPPTHGETGRRWGSSQSLSPSGNSLRKVVHPGQSPVPLVQVHAVPHDEVVGDGETYVVVPDGCLAPLRFVQQDAKPQRGRAHRPQALRHRR